MELCQYPYQGKTRYFTIEAIQIPIVYINMGIMIQFVIQELMWGITQESRPLESERANVISGGLTGNMEHVFYNPLEI